MTGGHCESMWIFSIIPELGVYLTINLYQACFIVGFTGLPNYLGPPVHSSGAISISSRPVEMPFVSVCVCGPKANKSTINLKHVNVEGLLFTKNCLSPHTNWFDYIPHGSHLCRLTQLMIIHIAAGKKSGSRHCWTALVWRTVLRK